MGAPCTGVSPVEPSRSVTIIKRKGLTSHDLSARSWTSESILFSWLVGALTLLFVRQRDEPLSRLLAYCEANIVALIEMDRRLALSLRWTDERHRHEVRWAKPTMKDATSGWIGCGRWECPRTGSLEVRSSASGDFEVNVARQRLRDVSLLVETRRLIWNRRCSRAVRLGPDRSFVASINRCLVCKRDQAVEIAGMLIGRIRQLSTVEKGWRNARCTGRLKRSQKRRLRHLRALLSNPANRRLPKQLGPGSYPSRSVLIDSPHEKVTVYVVLSVAITCSRAGDDLLSRIHADLAFKREERVFAVGLVNESEKVSSSPARYRSCLVRSSTFLARFDTNFGRYKPGSNTANKQRRQCTGLKVPASDG
ncbi:hypothetical protein KC361_g282 [Hortaea werneckii]|nr:hypothetical protein KC361_g282 [Hortaea werneckii]